MSWVQNTEPNGWVNFFSGIVATPPYDDFFNSFGQNAGFQEREDSLTAIYQAAWTFPIVIMAVAIIVAMVSFVCVCCCAPKKCGRSCWPALGMCLTAMFLTFVGFGYFLATAEAGSNTMKDAYDTSLDHFNSATDASGALGLAFSEISTSLSTVRNGQPGSQPDCALPPDMQQKLGELITQADGGKTRADETVGSLNQMTAYMKDADIDTNIDQTMLIVNVVCLLPLVFALAACCMQMFIMFSTVCCKEGSCWLKLEDIICFKIGSFVLVGTILIIAGISSHEMSIAMGVSQACSLRGAQGQGNGDGFMLKLAQAATLSSNGGDPKTYDEVYYFLTGDGTGPVEIQLAAFQTQVDAFVAQAVEPLKIQFKDEPTCLTPVSVLENHVQQVVEELSEVGNLVSAPQLYPYYDMAVHQVLCGTVVAGLGVVSVLQLIVGLILLPLMACFVHAYVAHKYQKDLKKSKKEKKGLMDSDSGSDSDSS